jgi:hypothetical protein
MMRRAMCYGVPFGGIISTNSSDRMIASSILAAVTARLSIPWWPASGSG